MAKVYMLVVSIHYCVFVIDTMPKHITAIGRRYHMGMTTTQKILARHAGIESVAAGDLILAGIGRLLGNDVMTPPAIDMFTDMGARRVFDSDKITLVMDHFTPNKDINAAENCKTCRVFAKEMGISGFYEAGDMGIEHALLPELGLVTAGDLVIGADSHTCTYGAVGAFSTGVGSTDFAAAMVTGKVWLKVPGAIKVILHGKPAKWVSGKDIILHIIGMLGVDGALYHSIEFMGGGVAALSVSDRLCICNMVVEAGAKNGIFPVDGLTAKYLENCGAGTPVAYVPDEDAHYIRTVGIDLNTLKPVVAFPHLPSNTYAVENAGHIPIDQAFIGSCTNGRYEDLAAAAEVLKGRKVAKGVRTIIIPATPLVYRRALEGGLIKIFIDAGAVVSTPTCGPCFGGHMGVLAKGERAVATTNRNSAGRMGHAESEVYLASPAVAAASAVTGRISEPGEVVS